MLAIRIVLIVIAVLASSQAMYGAYSMKYKIMDAALCSMSLILYVVTITVELLAK